MPIKAYVGQMRSGKTYEVVSNVILQGLRDGRRVVSNIAGLNYQLMVDMLLAEGIPIEKIGKLVCVTHEDVAKPSFWRTDKDAESGFDSFIQPGDLVALDEVWRFWKKRGDIDPRAMNFVRMHGHMPHPETGLICEIALISQLIRDINENVRDVVQETYRTTKLTAVGSDKSYRVDIFSGGSTARGAHLRQLMCRYDSKYFPLYFSHSQKTGVDAVEKNIDKRGNVLSGAFFKLIIPAMIAVGCFSAWFVYGFFNPAPKKTETAKAESSRDRAPAPAAQVERRQKADTSDEWRAVGWFTNSGGELVVLLEDSKRRTRTVFDPPGFKVHGWQIAVKLPEGDIATTYSGGAIERALPGARK